MIQYVSHDTVATVKSAWCPLMAWCLFGAKASEKQSRNYTENNCDSFRTKQEDHPSPSFLSSMRLPYRNKSACIWIAGCASGLDTITGLILGLRPANERRRYFVTTSLSGWAQTWTQPCITYGLSDCPSSYHVPYRLSYSSGWPLIHWGIMICKEGYFTHCTTFYGHVLLRHISRASLPWTPDDQDDRKCVTRESPNYHLFCQTMYSIIKS